MAEARHTMTVAQDATHSQRALVGDNYYDMTTLLLHFAGTQYNTFPLSTTPSLQSKTFFSKHIHTESYTPNTSDPSYPTPQQQ